MDKNDPLVLHTLCGLGILNKSGQIIYFNMILDQPSNTAQPSSTKDSSSSIVGKLSMPSKQFGITYTTEGRRKMGVHLTVGVNSCILLAWGNVLPKLSLFSLFLHNSKWVTATLQQAITEPKSQTFLSKSLVITLWKWHSTPELESLSTGHPEKQKPSSRGGGITSKSTVAQQQSQLSARRNRPSSNIDLQRISTLGATSAPYTYSTIASQQQSQGRVPSI
ncbi:hypothetical protein CRG98_021479 [Punica granatum]|uniref:Uncharacterized protein n=1 Tax=Punica granatum TaxID=22663 RepID=A0A2I0JQF4_PUNGR|nr:hypothetical protein CRG98_021479 [Punica granatum]